MAIVDRPWVSDKITYGCSIHIFQLLVKDVHIPTIFIPIKDVIKYIRTAVKHVGVEHVFIGLVCTSLRNRLEVERRFKLVTV